MFMDNLHEVFKRIKNGEFKRTILYSLAGFIFLVFGFSLGVHNCKGGPLGSGTNKYELIILSGDTPTRVSRELEINAMIRSSKYFLFLLKISGNIGSIKQGVYSINDSMSTWKIIHVLVEGRVKTIVFTIPEGYTNRQIASVLVNKKIISNKNEFLAAADNGDLLKKYKIPAKTTEGYLFPETYTIPYDYKANKIVEMMLKRFYNNLEKVEGFQNETPESLHKKVIMASIVEREAKKKDEQPLMAGVFTRRLKINMPLESCATVQYLFDKPKSRLLERDLEIESPYNTYLHKGFPPGPISNPGLPAIMAAFKPVESENLFFLVKPDGSHYFSKNHKEHLEAKKKYIDVLYE
jgi:UPF0755 protein